VEEEIAEADTAETKAAEAVEDAEVVEVDVNSHHAGLLHHALDHSHHQHAQKISTALSMGITRVTMALNAQP